MILTPKNWKSFQHYKDRSPSWIKLHKALLDDYEFSCLPVASRALAPMLWLLASEYDDGKIDATLDKLAFRLRMTRGELADALTPLIEKRFFDASDPLADCKQDAIPEKENIDKKKEEEEREIEATASASPPDPAIPEREFFLRGREVLGPKSGAMIANLLKAKGRNVALARAALEQASTKQNPLEFVAAICRGPPVARASTVHQQRQAEGKAVLDELHEFNTRTSGREDSGILRQHTGDGPEGICGGPGGNLIELSAGGDRPRG